MMTPDRVSGWATGIGIGFAAFIIAWTVLNRLTGIWLPTPQGPIVALTTAVLVGVGMALQRGTALSRRTTRVTN
jgi:hypothetical protein